MFLNKKAQSTLEYAIIIAVVVAGFLAMQAYVKRSVQGRIRDAADDVGEQFSPDTADWQYTYTTHSESKEEVGGTLGDGGQKTTLQGEGQWQKKSGHENIGAFD